jgi:hypothetical protein
MRTILHYVAFLFFLDSAVIAGTGAVPLLPDYEREARLVFQGSCDGGKISYNTYHKPGGYILEVATIQSEGSYYFMKRYLGEAAGWQERYFIQSLGVPDPREFSHDDWDYRVKRISANYFNKLHDLETTCSKALVM